MGLVWAYLYQLLYDKDFVAAAMMLWNEETFTGEPECTRLVWEALMTKRMICVIGGGGLGKTFCTCAYFLLEWIADPEWTRIQIASNSKDHLQKNALGDIMRLYSDAALVLPGKADSESISLEKKRAHGIFSLVLPGGPQSKGKLKGSHTKARPPHPKFGRRSRVFCLIDESQEAPQNIFGEIPNRFSTVDGDDVDHIKFVLTANAKDIFSQFAACAKPKKGWESIKRADKQWVSESGWTVVSLDAMEHENVKQRRKVYPGFVTWEGVQERLRACHGNWDDPQMWTFVYGKFPPAGLASSIIKQHWLTASEKEWIFDSMTVAKAGADPAFTGDRPALTTARVGRAIGWIDHAGDRHMLPEPGMRIQIDATSVVERTPDSQILADRYMEQLKPLGVQPDGFGIDTTGGGRGPHDIIRHQWATKIAPIEGLARIHAIEYASSPSEIKIAHEDTATPKQMFDIMASALWYEAAKLFEMGVIGIGKNVDLKVMAELAGRQGGMQAGLGKRLTVESKGEFKKRTGMDSPDLADSALICIHVARISTPGLVPRSKDTPADKPSRDFLWSDARQNAAWSGFNAAFGSADIRGMDGGTTCDLIKD